MSAADGPGALSHFDLARKDCVGTAGSKTSKTWFTVAGGVLSDVYSPTVDNTNVETMQFVVTDGATFTDLQARDMTYTVRSAGPSGMSCEITSTAKSGKYRLVTTYFTDPERNSVLASVRLVPLTVDPHTLHLYLRLDPSINGNGGGGTGNGGADSAVVDSSTGQPIPVAFDTKTSSNAANRDYAVAQYAALAADRPFRDVAVGFAGAPSDGLTQLDTARSLTTPHDTAVDGNVTETVALDLSTGNSAQVALGFGSTQGRAVDTATASVATPID